MSDVHAKRLLGVFAELANAAGPAVIGAEVVSADAGERTCIVELPTGLKVEDVRLQVLTGGDAGLVLVPAAGADCLLLKTASGLVMLLCTELASVALDVAGEIVINGGENDGIPKSPDVAARLNKIEQDLNTIKNVFKSWDPVPNDGGAALKGAVAGWAGQRLEQTTVEQIANPKLKH